MPRRSPDTDPGPVPTEAQEKRTRWPALPLSDKAAEIIRRTAEYTDLSQAAIKISIAAFAIPDGTASVRSLDALVEVACRGLCESHDRDRAAERESIFHGKEAAGGDIEA